MKNYEKLRSECCSECCSLPFSVLLRFLARVNGIVGDSSSLLSIIKGVAINTSSISLSHIVRCDVAAAAVSDVDVAAADVDAAAAEVDASATGEEVDMFLLFFALVTLDFPDKRSEILSLFFFCFF